MIGTRLGHFEITAKLGEGGMGVVYLAEDLDHIPPRNEFIKETLAWLDRYLGPVGEPG